MAYSDRKGNYGYGATRQTEGTFPLIPGYNLVFEYALQNLSISIFIKVLPTSVPRIVATHQTTLMNHDGGCRYKRGQHFLRFYLRNAKEQNLDDRPRDIQHSASNVLLDVLVTTVNTTKKYTSVMIRVCHNRSRFLSCMYIHDDFMTESRQSYLCCRRSVP